MNIQTLFQLAMKREVPQLLDFPTDGLILNLGAGNSRIPGAVNLDFPEWNAENYVIEIDARTKHHLQHPNRAYPLPADAGSLLVTCPDESVAGIHAYHFLEHVRDPRRMLREMQRVLQPGGVINICVPHFSGSMAHHDLDHKNTYAIDTWANAFSTPYYNKDREGWKLRIHFNMMLALVERNTAIITQLVKE